MFGLCLGWYFAGLALPTATLAYDGHGHVAAAGHGGGHGDNAAIHAAEALRPTPDQVRWYPAVVKTAVGLFVAAVILGIPAMKLRGPEPAEPPEHADSAGHDDHGHVAGH